MRSAILAAIAFISLGLGITAAYAMSPHTIPSTNIPQTQVNNAFPFQISGTITSVDQASGVMTIYAISRYSYADRIDMSIRFDPDATIRTYGEQDGSSASSTTNASLEPGNLVTILFASSTGPLYAQQIQLLAAPLTSNS